MYIDSIKEKQGTTSNIELDDFALLMIAILNPLNPPRECTKIEEINKVLDKLKDISCDPDQRAEHNYVMRMKKDMSEQYRAGFRNGLEEARKQINLGVVKLYNTVQYN